MKHTNKFCFSYPPTQIINKYISIIFDQIQNKTIFKSLRNEQEKVIKINTTKYLYIYELLVTKFSSVLNFAQAHCQECRLSELYIIVGVGPKRSRHFQTHNPNIYPFLVIIPSNLRLYFPTLHLKSNRVGLFLSAHL